MGLGVCLKKFSPDRWRKGKNCFFFLYFFPPSFLVLSYKISKLFFLEGGGDFSIQFTAVAITLIQSLAVFFLRCTQKKMVETPEVI